MTVPVNFDANASHSLLPEVVAALRRFDGGALNPSSLHTRGQRARLILDESREAVLELLGLGQSDFEVVFTSGATEANNLALAVDPGDPGGPTRFLASEIEHPSVLNPLSRAVELGHSLMLIHPLRPPDKVADFDVASLMAANNETGTVLPLACLIGAIRSGPGHAKIHCDAVQAAGKLRIDYRALGIDVVTVSGHKFGALPGAGALVIRKGVRVVPQLLGGPQEGRRRAGTENVVGIHSLGVAARAAHRAFDSRTCAMQEARHFIRRRLEAELPEAAILQFGHDSLPNTLSVRIPGVRADDLVVACDLEGVCISSGAACGSGKPSPSHVLLALGLTESQARETIRISLEGDYPPGCVEQGCSAILRCARRMLPGG